MRRVPMSWVSKAEENVETTHAEYFAGSDGAVFGRRVDAEVGNAKRRQPGRNLIGRREGTYVVHQEDAVHGSG